MGVRIDVDCTGCKYEDLSLSEEPCNRCLRNEMIFDEYVKAESEEADHGTD